MSDELFKLWPHTPDGTTKMGYAVTVSPEHSVVSWWPMADAGQARNECEKANRIWRAARGPELTKQRDDLLGLVKEIADIENPEHYGNARDTLHSIKLRCSELLEHIPADVLKGA